MSIVVANWAGISLKASPWVKRVTLVSIATGAVLPLALLKNMAALSKTSFISLAAVVVILSVVVNKAVVGPGDAPVPVTEAERALRFVDVKFFSAIGVISFAFVCHHACFIVFNGLRDNTEERWAKTCHLTLATATSVMWVLAVCAFFTFRGIIKGSFLTNYSYTDPVCNFMRCLFAIAQTLTYPIELFVARHSIHAIAFPAQRWTDSQHYLITLLLWGSSVAIALNVADLGAVLEITGGLAAVSIGFVLPVVLQFKMTPELNWRVWRNKPSRRWDACKLFAPSYFVFVIGAFAMLFTLVAMVDEFNSGELEAHDAFDVDANGNPIGHAPAAGATTYANKLDLTQWGRALARPLARALFSR